MGQKVNPKGLRIGVNKNWDSRWFADKKNTPKYIKEDNEIRKILFKKLDDADLSKVEIERIGEKVKLNIHTAKPGMVIGKGGAGIEEIKNMVSKIVSADSKKDVFINIEEVRNVDADAQLVAKNIARALERRIAFRRAMKQAMQRSMKNKAVKGIKVLTSGRLGGAEMARSEGYNEGVVPLHTLRADIDYGFAEADTTYGKLGVKVWICKGMILKDTNRKRSFDDLMNPSKNDRSRKNRNDRKGQDRPSRPRRDRSTKEGRTGRSRNDRSRRNNQNTSER